MIKLASLLNEIRVLNPGGYQRVLDLYIDHQFKTINDWGDDEEATEYIKSLKSNPRVNSVEELASAIKEIDDRLTEFAGEYPGMFFEEAVVTVLEQIVSENPYLKKAVDEVLVILRELYGDEENEDEEEDEDDDEFGWAHDYDEY
jgi:hypothetical protein